MDTKQTSIVKNPRCSARALGAKDPYTRIVGNRIYFNPFYIECELAYGHEGPHEGCLNGKPFLFPNEYGNYHK